MLSLFDVAISRTQGLSSLEPAIMENLFWASTPVLSSVHPQVRATPGQPGVAHRGLLAVVLMHARVC
jgi:dynein heavy chain